MTMTNKEYKLAREDAENAIELDTFEHYHENGFWGYYSRYMSADDLKTMRKEIKNDKKNHAGIVLDEFNNRAVIIPVDNGYILKSYYTNVAAFIDGKFIKLWGGFSVTTLKHINAFRRYLKLDYLSKREWIELEAGNDV